MPTTINFSKVYTLKSNATRDIVKVVERGEYQREDLDVIAIDGGFMVINLQPGHETWSEPATSDNAPEILDVPSDDISAYLPTTEAAPIKPKKSTKGTLNENEKLMLSTIPQIASFVDANSIVTGKDFVAKVKELHGIAPRTVAALMVSLRKKEYYRIKGKKAGQKHTTIHLLPRGIEYLGLTV
jgi:methionine aminopeptidase